MEFGIFDHLDRYDVPLPEYYEARLKLIELYDSAGFHSYHLAEHHGTPLGMAPSPSVFLAAVAQRSKRLRFGPMVYALPLYHPLRLIEEICMLDQMSGGRLDIGFGRGASPIELAYFGRDAKEAQAIYAEGIELVLKGLTEKTVSFSGKYFHFDKVPMEIAPLQKPYPPCGTACMCRKRPSAPRGGDCTPSISIRRRRRNSAPSAIARSGARRAGTLRYPCSASAASSWWRRPTRPRSRWRAAPIRYGTMRSRSCRACTG